MTALTKAILVEMAYGKVSELTWISKSPLTPFCQRGVLKYHGRLNWTLSGFDPYEGRRKNGN
jgi:hypothetical protein